MKIGIIGAENSHSLQITKLINIDHKFKNADVTHIWGETDELARKLAADGKVPHIAAKSQEMVGKVDALIICHRHGKFHLPAAKPFLKSSIPIFIDKPLSCGTPDCTEFLKQANKTGTAIASFSIVPFQKSFKQFCAKMPDAGKIASGVVSGPADYKSVYGSVYFYGIHHVECTLNAFGFDVESVRAVKFHDNILAQLFYPDQKVIALNFIKPPAILEFSISAVGDKAELSRHLSYDKSPFINSTGAIINFFRTGLAPVSNDILARPVEILDAVLRSVKSDGKLQKLTKLTAKA